jgi:hypothetical protein
LVLLSIAAVLINIRIPIPDSVLGLDVAPGRFLGDIFQTWTAINLGQRVNGTLITYLPVALLYTGLHGLGLSILHIQQLWFSLVIATSAVGMMVLYRCWWNDASSLRAMVAGSLYAFSPYMLLNLKGASVLLVPYAALPWLAHQAILGVRRRRIRHLVGAAVIVALLSPGINPPLTAIMFAAAAAIAVGELARQQWRRECVWWLVATGAAMLLASAWWIGPFVSAIRAGGAGSYFVSDPLSMDAASSSFREVLRLTGLWALYQGWDGVPYYSSSAYLTSGPVVALTLLAPLTAFLAVWRLWPEVRAKVLAVLVIVSVPLAVSIYPVGHPGLTGQLYLWAYSHLFFFRAFRSTYKWVWPLAFAYALLIPTLLRAIPIRNNSKHRISINLRAITTGTVLCILAVYVIPFAKQLVFPANYQLGTIPTYWYQATSWLDHQPGPGRALFLPTQGFSIYNWGSPSGDIASLLMQRPEITANIDSVQNSEAQQLLDSVGVAPASASVPFASALSLLNVSYVVQRNDINWRYYSSASPAVMHAFLTSQPSLHLEKSFGELDIYKVVAPAHSVVGVASAVESVVTDQELSTAVAIWNPGTLAQFSQAIIENPSIQSFQSSSVWNDQVDQYGPQMAFNGNLNGAWVSGVAGGVGQWIQTNFTHARRLGKVTVVARQNGVDALPRRLLFIAGDRQIPVVVGVNGVAEANFEGVTTRSLRIAIVSSGQGGPNVGISKIDVAGLPSNSVVYPPLPAQDPARYLFDFSSPTEGSLSHVIASGPARTGSIGGVAQVDQSISSQALSSYLVPVGVTSVTASSRSNDLAAFSPLWVISGDPAMAWVSNTPGGVGQWIQFNFPAARLVGSVSLRGREDGVNAEATSVHLTTADGRDLGVRNLVPNSNGVASIAVNASISSLRITIVASQSGRPSDNVGFSEIGIEGVGVKRDTAALNIPALLINNGRVTLHLGPSSKLATGPNGAPSVSDATAAGLVSYPFLARVQLAQGPQALQVVGAGLEQVSQLTLAVGNSASAAIRWLPVRQSDAEHLSTLAPSGESYLLLDETADPFWQATQKHNHLIGAGTANAYGKLWRLPVRGGPVDLSFSSGLRHALWLLDWGIAMIGLTLIAISAAVWRRRRVQRADLNDESEAR